MSRGRSAPDSRSPTSARPAGAARATSPSTDTRRPSLICSRSASTARWKPTAAPARPPRSAKPSSASPPPYGSRRHPTPSRSQARATSPHRWRRAPRGGARAPGARRPAASGRRAARADDVRRGHLPVGRQREQYAYRRGAGAFQEGAAAARGRSGKPKARSIKAPGDGGVAPAPSRTIDGVGHRSDLGDRIRDGTSEQTLAQPPGRGSGDRVEALRAPLPLAVARVARETQPRLLEVPDPESPPRRGRGGDGRDHPVGVDMTRDHRRRGEQPVGRRSVPRKAKRLVDPRGEKALGTVRVRPHERPRRATAEAEPGPRRRRPRHRRLGRREEQAVEWCSTQIGAAVALGPLREQPGDQRAQRPR